MNNFSISSVGIGEALKRSASALASANNTLDESIALITAGNNVIQDPESVGTALKTVSLRLRSTATEIEGLGEDADGAVENVSKLRDLLLTLTNNKVDIQLDEDTYKSTYEIMLEMSKVWSSMNDMSQASALEAMFGKRQANIGASIISNMKDAENALTTSLTSAGSAMREQEAYMQGIQYSADRMKAAFQELASNTLNSSWVKGFYDLAYILTEVIDKVGLFNIALITTAGILGGKGILPVIPAVSKALTGLMSSFGLAGASASAFVSSISAILPVVIGLVAIKGVTYLFDTFNTSLEEVQETLEKQKSVYDNTTNEIKSLEDELQAVNDKIKEINSLGGTAITKDGELEKLQAQTEELDRQLTIAKEKQRVEGFNAEKTAVKSLSTTVKSKYDYDLNISNQSDIGNLLGITSEFGTKVYNEVTRDEELNNAMSEYNRLASEKSAIDEQLYQNSLKLSSIADTQSKEYKALTSENEKLNKQSESYTESMDKARNYASELANALDIEEDSLIGATDEGNALKESINTLLDSYSLWIDNLNGVAVAEDNVTETTNNLANTASKIKSSFDDAFNADSFSKFKEELLELSTSGELSAETLSSTEEYKTLLDETGLTAEDLVNKIDQFNLNNIDSSLSELEATLARVKNNETFSEVEIANLIGKYDDLAGSIDEATDGFTIEEDALVSLTNKVIEHSNTAYSAQINATQTAIEQTRSRIETYQAEIDAVNELVKKWSEYSDIGEFLANEGYAQTINEFGQEAYNAYIGSQGSEDLLNVYLEKLEGLNGKLNSNKTNSSKSGSSKAKDTYNEFSQSIDLAAEKIKILENEISKLDARLKNTSSVKGQISIYNQLINKQSELATAYKKSSDLYKNEYSSALSKLSPTDKKKVMNGSYSIEQFSGSAKSGETSAEESRYNEIQDAIKLRDQLADVNTSYSNIVNQLQEYAKSMADIRWDKSQEAIDKLTAKLDYLDLVLSNAKNSEEKNKILQKQLKIQKEITAEIEKVVKLNKSDLIETSSALLTSLSDNGFTKKQMSIIKSNIANNKEVSLSGLSGEDLELAIQYNAQLREWIENNQVLLEQKEKQKSSEADTKQRIYDNKKGVYDNDVSSIDNNMKDIENSIAEAQSLGQEATEAQLNNLIELSKSEVQVYKQKKRLAENELKSNNLSEEQIAKYKQEVQDCEDAISNAIVSQNEWNKSILSLPIQKLEDANDSLQKTLDTLNKTKDRYDGIINAVTDSIEDEIESIEDAKSAQEDYYNGLIENIQNEIDALQDANDARKKAIELQQAQYALERAQNQEIKKIYRAGEGFVYEADQTAITEAQNKLDDLAYQSIIDAKEEEIEALEDAKESALASYDEQIDRLNVIRESWNDIADTYEKIANIKLADGLFGSNWQESILSGDSSYLDKIGSMYSQVESKITSIENEIESNQEKIDSINSYIKAWENAKISVQSAYNAIQAVVGNNSAELESTNQRKDETILYGDEWGLTQEKIDTALKTIEESQYIAKDNEKLILDERLANFQTFSNQMKDTAMSLANVVSSMANTVSSALAGILSDLSKAQSAASEISSLKSSSTTSNTSTSTFKSQATKVTKKHSGMETGYVTGGDSTSNAKDLFEQITLQKLQPNEVPIIAQEKEAVLTKLQQQNVLSNINSAYKAGLTSNLPSTQPLSNTKSVSYQMGDIILQGVKNTEELSNEIKKNFLQKISQIEN